MTTPIMWEPEIMSTARTTAFTRSADAPSGGEVRPFGLSLSTTVDEPDLPELPQLTYDPRRQLSVDSNGNPLAPGSGGIIRAATSHDTRYDNQWFVDQD